MGSVTEWVDGFGGDAKQLVNEHGLVVFSVFIGAAILYYLGAWLVGSIVRKLVVGRHYRTWHRKDIEKRQNTLAALAVSIWKIMVVLVAGLTILMQVFPDINLAPLFASAGILGVALGFGAQSVIKDFLSGIFIISENQYRVGDVIEVEGASGIVERIGTRSTVIRDEDGNVHYFPNGMLSHVINKTMGYSMARFTISVHPTSDLEKVIGIINMVGEELTTDERWQSKILDAPQFVAIDDFTENAVELLVSGKVQPSDQWEITAEMRRRLLETFELQHIKLAGASVTKLSPRKSKKAIY